jgi:hypothetical protein
MLANFAKLITLLLHLTNVLVIQDLLVELLTALFAFKLQEQQLVRHVYLDSPVMAPMDVWPLHVLYQIVLHVLMQVLARPACQVIIFLQQQISVH